MANKVTSSVFEHYEVPEDHPEKYRAKCKHCAAAISTSGKATSNLLAQIKVLLILNDA